MAGDDEAELLRRFDAVTSGQELAELRDLAAVLLGPEDAGTRPSLRRPRLPGPRVLTLLVQLDHAEPPIWRRLEVRSDLLLSDLHQVLQAAYGWEDRHLWRFALGGAPFEDRSEVFLCPFDVDDGEGEADEGGVAASDVRLDEVLQRGGDVLRYVYDYGDQWGLTIRVEQSLPADAGHPLARCTGGERAAPPENSGGLVDAIDLVDVLPDPAAFDPRDVESGLRSPYLALRARGALPALAELLGGGALRSHPLAVDLVARLLEPAPGTPGEGEVAAAFRAHRWFLDRAYVGGLPLGPDGRLRPDDVAAAAAVVPATRALNRLGDREPPAVRDFRDQLVTLGLLRDCPGRLQLTAVGSAVRTDVDALRAHVVRRLAPRGEDRFVDEANLLVLAYAAVNPGGQLPLAKAARLLGELGWKQAGRPITHHHLLHVVPTVPLLRDITADPVDLLARTVVSPVASAIARAVVFDR